MHKSIIIFLGLLTFLLPVAPSVSHSNALAFNDYGYQADKYEKYANDMANDNYYKSHGSDVVKKIKCNNINANINGVEANIETTDPLGVGAASLQDDDTSASWFANDQRNNGNFDLDCINNNNNNAGGQGGNGTGSQGPQGPPGQPGLSTITTDNVYTNVGPTKDIFTNDFTSSVALCDENDTALSGSFAITFEGGIGEIAPIVSSKPLANETGWNATGWQNTSGNSRITGDVVCFDNPPAHVEMAAVDVAALQQPEDSVIMSQETGNSPKISQITGDSPDLTAMEKITKLKTQWLNQLP
jgi:hypothetical protein